MEVGSRESVALARGALLALRGKKQLPEVVVCPSFPALADVRKVIARSHVSLGAQNVHHEEKGAFTGEVSARMLEEQGASFCLVGHSERRAMGETDAQVAKKVSELYAHGITPVLCVGETLAQRKSGISSQAVTNQLQSSLTGVSIRGRDRLCIAYEPIWAIGTGTPASPQDAVAMHDTIRQRIGILFPGLASSRLQVLYGGSIDATNAYRFLREPEVGGLLIGGASVHLSQFTKIIAEAADVLEGLSHA